MKHDIRSLTSHKLTLGMYFVTCSEPGCDLNAATAARLRRIERRPQDEVITIAGIDYLPKGE